MRTQNTQTNRDDMRKRISSLTFRSTGKLPHIYTSAGLKGDAGDLIERRLRTLIEEVLKECKFGLLFFKLYFIICM